MSHGSDVLWIDLPDRSPLRQAITARTRAPEAACVATLLPEATLPPELAEQARRLATSLVMVLRKQRSPGLVQALVREYDLSTREGVALMCLAEALLRIPDTATRDVLIREKIAGGRWSVHLGGERGVFVNAATWGLMVSGRVLTAAERADLPRTLGAVVTRLGMPAIRQGVTVAMRLMGAQFVTGQSIGAALRRSEHAVRQGFRYSYDMLGEAATTAGDAARYYRDYERAIHAIGRASAGQGVYRGPGISVKLSALHPRYARLKRARVLDELLPRLTALAQLARHYDIGFNIDAEEAERLELSLDLLEALCLDPALAGWNGIGFVVQAYQKRAPAVIDWLVDLARRSGHRLMIRLVKGAYWDSEIKRAQVAGLADFPVFTVKTHTDLSYIACARRLLGARGHVFPQFATHNAQTLAAIHALAGPDTVPHACEFQCLHGMGENLYRHVVGPDGLDRAVRIYAPVGTYETLLAYLVRRLLENGANSSFVNRIQDAAVSVEELVCDPVSLLSGTGGAPARAIRLPPDLYRPERVNSIGLDLTDEFVLAALTRTVSLPDMPVDQAQDIRNPADFRDVVGRIAFMTPDRVDDAIARAVQAVPGWAARPVQGRAASLERAADRLEAEMLPLVGLIVREAGKSCANAVAEVREAVDFLRYYAARAIEEGGSQALGVVACISPWNFPLAIFMGQVAAALAAGNVVLAKPAEETPLIAREAVRLLHEAGVAEDAVQLLPGAGEVGARLVADARVQGVLFTGSNGVARLIARQLAGRLSDRGTPVPLIAETGGQNALVVDSSALPEQVVADVLSSAFDSAGQRCSALRVLCLQDDSADTVLRMLRGAIAELQTGNPAQLSTDVGPVISAEAQATIEAHVAAMRQAGYAVYRAPLDPACVHGTFVAPTLIEIPSLSVLKREVFGPVLHVLRYRREGRDALIDAINATGYALTFGVHTRLDTVAARVTSRAHAGNIYVNRNLVGAVVGVQPFGGHGLSGTGPKAGGPLYLRRLLARVGGLPERFHQPVPPVSGALDTWMRDGMGDMPVGPVLSGMTTGRTPLGTEIVLPGPVGEENIYRLEPRGRVFCAGGGGDALFRQIAAAICTGNIAVLTPEAFGGLPPVPLALEAWIVPFSLSQAVDVALCGRDDADLAALGQALARRPGPIVPIYAAEEDGSYRPDGLVLERCFSTDTTAAGGNAALMMAS